MLRKNQHSICYMLVFFLLLAGMYTTYGNAKGIAEHAASLETIRRLASDGNVVAEQQENILSRIEAADNVPLQDTVYISESVSEGIKTVIGRATGRNSRLKRQLRLPGLSFVALVIAGFLLNCYATEAHRCFYEKKHRTTLIRYIHDMDGKKRMSCLTSYYK